MKHAIKRLEMYTSADKLGVRGSPHVRPPTRRRVRHVGISPIAHVAQQNTAEIEARALLFLAVAHVVLPTDIRKRIFPLLPLSLLRLSLLRLGLDGRTAGNPLPAA
jgi:hypothetical protein